MELKQTYEVVAVDRDAARAFPSSVAHRKTLRDPQVVPSPAGADITAGVSRSAHGHSP